MTNPEEAKKDNGGNVKLAELKEEANDLGVDYAKNIGYDKLLEKVEGARTKEERRRKKA